MITNLSPQEARALVDSKAVSVVDVREPHEWESGHVPGAQLVSLGVLKADWGAAAIPDAVLFVCARGGRSQIAAELAERRGLGKVYNLLGGTAAWTAAGLPVEYPPAAVPASKTPEFQAETDPELTAVVGLNLKELRAKRHLTLDLLAGLSGVGRQTLGQIEIGRARLSVSTLRKLARALEVPFSALLTLPASGGATRVFRTTTAQRIFSVDGRFSSRTVFSADENLGVEFYELWLAPRGREDAEGHAPGTRENLVVTSGRLVLAIGQERFELSRGDGVTFIADAPHSYINPGAEECWLSLVMTYAT
jgi:rhodanese-related sulfurtransferase/transcriptional regulator with XRE-family HTH domain